MKMFDTKPKPGMPVRHSTFFNALVRMAKAWETLKIYNGHVDWSNGMPTIVVDSGAAGLDVRGTKTLYKVVALREYDADGVLIAAGSETGGEGRTLEGTWDWTRWA